MFSLGGGTGGGGGSNIFRPTTYKLTSYSKFLSNAPTKTFSRYFHSFLPSPANMPINSETAVSYAALILADEGLEVTPDKLQTLLKAAGLEIEPIWSTIFAKALKGTNIKEILTSIENSGPSGPNTNGSAPMEDNGDDGLSCPIFENPDTSSDGDEEGMTGSLLFD